MKKLFGLILICVLGQSSFAQMDPHNQDSIKNIEFQLEGLSNNILNGKDLDTRVTSCFYFIQTLKKALLVPQSFQYKFPLLKNKVLILEPEDSKFRFFTWNLLLDSGKMVYFGALQMNNDDSLILYGLYDSSDFVKEPEYDVLDHRHWMGALYYQIQPFKHKKKTHYMLFGYDGQDAKQNRKIIDVLWFDDEDKPHFGAEVFDIDGDLKVRLIFEYNDRAAMLCRYDEDEDIVVYSNLVPPNPMLAERKETYLPDGTYDYLEYEKGYWVRHEMVFKDAKDPGLYRDPENVKKPKKRKRR